MFVSGNWAGKGVWLHSNGSVSALMWEMGLPVRESEKENSECRTNAQSLHWRILLPSHPPKKINIYLYIFVYIYFSFGSGLRSMVGDYENVKIQMAAKCICGITPRLLTENRASK